MKKLHLLLLFLGVVFLTYLVWTIGVEELWHQLMSFGWGLIPLILIEGVADLAHTMGWRRCLSEPHRSLPLVVLFCIRMAGFAINYLTPTASLGGEVTKAALLASNHSGPEAASGVLIGKLCFAFAHLLLVVAGSMTILWRIQLPWALWVGMLISGSLVAGGIVAFLLIQKYGKLGVVLRWLVVRKLGGRLLERAARDITEVDEALKLFYRKRPWDLPLGVCWHLLGYSVGVFQTLFFLYLLNRNASLAVAVGAWVLGLWFDLLTFAVPLSLGTLEGSRILAFKAVGFDALLGMTYGVALRLAGLFWAGLGLVSYGFLSRAGHLRGALRRRSQISEDL